MKKTKFPYYVLAPMLLLLFIFIILPIIASFVFAFMDYNPLRSAEGNVFIGFANFKRLFTDELYIISLKNTLYYTFVMVAINLCLTLTTSALLCALSSNKWRSLFRTLFFLPCVAPLAAVAVVWQKCIFPIKGTLNHLFGLFGIPAVNWVGSAGMLMTSLLILSLWADVGYNTVLFIAGMQGIPKDFYEASEIDGAGPLRRFFSITMPLLTRTFTFVCIMTLISQFQAFPQFQILAQDGGPGRAGYVLSTYIYYEGFVAKDMGYASAVSVSLFLIILVVTLIQQRLNRVDWRY